MSRVADQLRVLCGDVGLAASIAATHEAVRSTRLEELRRLISRTVRVAGAGRRVEAPGGQEIAPGVRYVERVFKHDADPYFLAPRISAEPIDRRRLLCFDTETTGLAGGVGTRAFMIGVAAWACDRLVIRQLYLTTMAGEAAMLRTFANWLRDDTILVSYNGKSYDAPLLKGRLRLNRVEHRLSALLHADWLHPTRRAYRGILPNCRLATVEREILRIVRDDDLPGAQAPAAWFAFLRGQSSENLARVLDHNRQDVMTLMHLGDHLAKVGALAT